MYVILHKKNHISRYSKMFLDLSTVVLVLYLVKVQGGEGWFFKGELLKTSVWGLEVDGRWYLLTNKM